MSSKEKLRELRLTSQEKSNIKKKSLKNMTTGGVITCYACGIGDIDSWDFKCAMFVEQKCNDPRTV